MQAMKPVILITGATGNQGGALVSALLQADNLSQYDLLAVTRDTQSQKASKLQNQGVRLVKGDLEDVPAIFQEVKKVLEESKQSVWGVFSVQNPIGKNASVKKEELQGKALIDGALANNVKHFVYSSVDRGGNDFSYETRTDIPHFISKYHIEHHLVESAKGKMNWTILRPVTFMEVLSPGFIGKVMATSWKLVVKSRPLQLISVKDIGWFAAQAFLRHDEFAGRAISLAGDALTYNEANTVFQNVVGHEMPLTFQIVDRGILWASEELGTMFRWFESNGCQADIESLKREHPDMLAFGTWLRNYSEWPQK